MVLVALAFFAGGPQRRAGAVLGTASPTLALLALATILALSRVVVGTHYPGDVPAGAVIGAASSGVLFAVPVTRRILERVAGRAGALRDRVPSRA